MDIGYDAVMARKNQIMQRALGIDYEAFVQTPLAFDYEKMMGAAGYCLNEVEQIQNRTGVGKTPLIELKNLTTLIRRISPPGKGAKIYIKDEACNPSGSFKARRASVSVHQAKKLGYAGVVAATSGNYGAAVASQAAMLNLNCIVVQEVFDSRGVGQPEILEKGRKCEAYGAEVLQLTVGPELFYVFLRVLEETGYFNASLYTPFGIAGIETLGHEVACQVKEKEGRFPEVVVCTHAGGGNLTGTARGLERAGAHATQIIAASVDLRGLHMASDRDFNRKFFTTGHTGFGVPFMTWPDRADVPRNAARALRYTDRYVLVKQGVVFYITEALARLEGLERGPAGNISLAAAFALAREMDRDAVIVVQETEYTGAGKHPTAQLTFANQNGVEVRRGNPREEVAGENVIIPEKPEQIVLEEMDLNQARQSLIRNAVKHAAIQQAAPVEVEFLMTETKTDRKFVIDALTSLGITIESSRGKSP
jgi:cysteine synthase